MTEPLPPRLRRAILALLTLVTSAGVIGAALAPLLLVKSPLLLVAVSAAAHHVALAAATEDPLALIVVTTLRRTLTLIASFGLGALYGPAAVSWLVQRWPRLARLVRGLERLFDRWGLLLLMVAPMHGLALLAGAARSRLVLFLPSVMMGVALWAVINVTIGDALSSFTYVIVAFLRAHLVESTLVCVALVAGQRLYARLAGPRSRATERGTRSAGS